MQNTKNHTMAAIILTLAMLACNAPLAPNEADPNAVATQTSTPSSQDSNVAAVPSSAPPASDCKPTLTTTTTANVRTGPGIVYQVLGTLPQGASANVTGKSADGAWWYIEFPAAQGGFAWVAGSVTLAACIPTTLAIIAAPAAPVAQQPQNTNDNKSDPTDAPQNSSPPSAPKKLSITKWCTNITQPGDLFQSFSQLITFSWVDTSDDETGFNVFKDGNLVWTSPPDTQTYGETFVVLLPQSPTITYGVQSLNKHGGSDIKEISIAYCQ